MLVKKINPAWQPAENRGLLVGETIEITDPEALILKGYAVAVDENGVELSTYESYGVLAGKEKEDFEQWLAAQRAEKAEAKLKAEQETLQKQVEELKVTEAKATETAKAKTK